MALKHSFYRPKHSMHVLRKVSRGICFKFHSILSSIKGNTNKNVTWFEQFLVGIPMNHIIRSHVVVHLHMLGLVLPKPCTWKRPTANLAKVSVQQRGSQNSIVWGHTTALVEIDRQSDVDELWRHSFMKAQFHLTGKELMCAFYVRRAINRTRSITGQFP